MRHASDPVLHQSSHLILLLADAIYLVVNCLTGKQSKYCQAVLMMRPIMPRALAYPGL